MRGHKIRYRLRNKKISLIYSKYLPLTGALVGISVLNLLNISCIYMKTHWSLSIYYFEKQTEIHHVGIYNGNIDIHFIILIP